MTLFVIWNMKSVNYAIAVPGSDVFKKGIPTSCTDLLLLGHMINGLYLIKTTEPGRGTKIEAVYCDFNSSNDVKGKYNL